MINIEPVRLIFIILLAAPLLLGEYSDGSGVGSSLPVYEEFWEGKEETKETYSNQEVLLRDIHQNTAFGAGQVGSLFGPPVFGGHQFIPDIPVPPPRV